MTQPNPHAPRVKNTGRRSGATRLGDADSATPKVTVKVKSASATTAGPTAEPTVKVAAQPAAAKSAAPVSKKPSDAPVPTITKPRRGGGATRVRGKARSLMRAPEPPTQPISMPVTADAISQRHARAVMDLTLRLGEAMLVTGASVADTTSAVLRVTKAYGLTSVHADITYTSITLSFHRGIYEDPITVMRIVTRLGMDYSRLERLHAMVREIAAEAIVHGEPGHVDDYLTELDFIVHQPHIYRRGIVTMAFAGMGVGVAALMGGSLLMMIIAACSTAVIDRMMYHVARLGISAFFGQMLGAMVAASVAAVLLWARSQWPATGWLWEIRPSLVVISGIVVLLAGSGVVAAAQDTLDGFYVTASARTYEVILLTSGIVAGVLAVLSIAKQLGVEMYLVPHAGLATNLVVQTLAAALISGALAVMAYCGPVATVVSTAIGGLSWVLFWISTELFGASQPIGSAVAVFIIGVAAPAFSRKLRIPSIAATTASVVPLMPGLLVYRGIMEFVTERNGEHAVPTLILAAVVGMALAGGVSLGTLLGRQIMADDASVTAKVLRRTVAEAE